MHLKHIGYDRLAQIIRDKESRIIVYGAGSIGKLVIPYILDKWQLHKYMDFFVDKDSYKIGTSISVGDYEYPIKDPEVLQNIHGNVIILITNSRAYPIIDYLDGIRALDEIDCYVIPMMQKDLCKPRIPKTIHYCWFGKLEMPDYLNKCVESWNTICPEYEIVRWNEDNYDISKYTYTSQAYERKHFGFVSDVVRLDILYMYGGIYFDTDVRLLKSLDGLLYQDGFIGTEKWGYVNSGGGIGAISRHPMIRELLDYRISSPLIRADGSIDPELNGVYETIPFIKHGMRIDNTLQVVNGMTVYPASYFHPYDYMTCEEEVDDSTISIHYFYGGWMGVDERKKRKNKKTEYEKMLNRMKTDDRL